VGAALLCQRLRELLLCSSTRVGCLIVGVVNCTPDSFSDGGRYASASAAVAGGLRLVEEGADWIDIGGESTRPGSASIPEAEERARVIPVIEGLRARLPHGVRVSVDTYKAGTARAALEAGATVVNDISGGLLDGRILETAGRAGAAVVLGHLRGPPARMTEGISFTDVVAEVGAELGERVEAARAAGCREVWVDPGIGFGKTPGQSLALLRALPVLAARLALPIMVGVSRKSFIGHITGRPAAERLFGTAAAVAAAVMGGAAAVRVHDVAEMRDVVRVAEAISATGSGASA
jgi:dihydropteroate synthase